MNYIGAPIFSPTVDLGTSADVVGTADGVTVTYVTSSIFDGFIDLIPYLWLIGIAAFLIYGIISFVKLKSQLSTATKYDKNIYQSEVISSPFILGIIKPKIYIPYSVDKDYFDYIIAHEKYHLKRWDNVIKAFAFLLLAIHWFNPFVWVAYYLMNKDMEMSCDEWVIAHNDNIKKQYSTALLSFATNKKFPSPSHLCFGENCAKSRIKNVLKYKKPAVIIGIIAVVLCVAVAVVCVANPIQTEAQNSSNQKEVTVASVSSSNQDDIDYEDDALTPSYYFDFIYNSYWYNVVDDGDDTVVCCSKYNNDYTLNITTYTKDKNGNWKTSNENCNFSFDENNTIVEYSDSSYSHAWLYVDTKKQCIEERDTATGDIIQTFVAKNENNLSTAKSML